VADISALYPQPSNNAPQGILAGNPLATAGQLMQLQQMQGQRATGSALLGAMNPDGTFDAGRAVTAAQANPNAAWNGAQFSKDVLANKASDINNSMLGVQREVLGNNAVAGYLSGWYGKNIGPNEAATIRANVVKLGGNPTVWGPLSDPGSIKSAVKTATVAAAGANTAISPTTTAPTSDLAPTVASNAGVVQNGDGGPRVVGAGAQQTADQTEYNADQTRSAQTLAGARTLQSALPLITKLGDTQFGPTSPEFTKAKATLAALGVIDPNTSDAAVRQEVGKYLLRYASGAQAAGRSDQALSASMGSNPNPDTMMKPAVLGVLKNQIGMDRMDAALPLAAGGAPGYKAFKSGYYQNLDPRAFSFDLMSKDEQAALQKSLGSKDSPAYKKFVQSYNVAKQTGMLTPPQAAQGQ
jgi:hypothetical protein